MEKDKNDIIEDTSEKKELERGTFIDEILAEYPGWNVISEEEFEEEYRKAMLIKEQQEAKKKQAELQEEAKKVETMADQEKAEKVEETTTAEERENIIGFEIPIKSRETKKVVGKQAITFFNKDKFLIGVQKDGTSLASIEINNNQPILIIDPEKLDLDLKHDHTVLEDGKLAFLLSDFEIDGDSNIKITTRSLKGDAFSKIQFLPNEIVVTKDTGIERHTVDTLDLSLPTNMFDIAKQKSELLKIKNLPSQFMKIMSIQENTETLTISHKGKVITFARVGDEENPTIYVAHGTQIFQHTLQDFYIYNPENKAQTGFLGIKRSKNSTSAYGLNNVNKENLNNILGFISNEKSREIITTLNKEEFESQVLKARTLGREKDREKFESSFVRNSPARSKETESPFEATPEATANLDESDDDEANAAAGAVDENSSSDSNVVVASKTSTNTSIKKESKEDEAEKNAVAKAKTTEPKQTPPPSSKPSEKTETVDLSDLAKLFGVGLFLFGLFSGFGGLLLQILAMGIGSSSFAFNKKLKDLPLPKGEKPFKESLAKAKKDGKIKDSNLMKKSTTKEEGKVIDDLEKEGVISTELALDLKETLKSLEQIKGYVEKIEDFFKRHKNNIHNQQEGLKAIYKQALRTHNHKEQKEISVELSHFKQAIEDLEKHQKDFNLLKEDFANILQTQIKEVEGYSENIELRSKYNKENIQENINKIETQMDNLIEQLEKKPENDAEQKIFDSNTKKKEYLDRELTLLYRDKSEIYQLDRKIEQAEKTFMSPELIESLKTSVVRRSKEALDATIQVVKDLEEKTKDNKFSFKGFDKKEKEIIKNINQLEVSQEM